MTDDATTPTSELTAAAEFEEQLEGYEGALLRVGRVVSLYDAEYEERSVEEFAAALLRAREGLTGAHVDAVQFYDSIQVRVVGMREPSAEEAAERDHREFRMWLAAKVRYEEGLARGFDEREPVAPLWTLEP